MLGFNLTYLTVNNPAFKTPEKLAISCSFSSDTAKPDTAKPRFFGSDKTITS